MFDLSPFGLLIIPDHLPPASSPAPPPPTPQEIQEQALGFSVHKWREVLALLPRLLCRVLNVEGFTWELRYGPT